MDTVRGFVDTNRGGIINVVYVIAFLVVLYYLYKFLIAGSEYEQNLLDVEVDANKPMGFDIKSDELVRINTGGEYTISFWMYINSWEIRSGQAKSVLNIYDNKLPDHALLTTILYPNEPKLMVRVHSDKPSPEGTDYTKNSNYDALMSGQGMDMFSSSITMPQCDIQDIDLQRWINITISVNGRIVDVYYDGKLNRSCILPDIPVASTNGKQVVVIGKNGGFGGKISGIQFFAFAATPDRIYSIYQAGPKGAAGFLGYIAEKLGIKLSYSGAGGKEKSYQFMV